MANVSEPAFACRNSWGISSAQRPRIKAYLASDRRIPFNQWGIFRYYKELDA